MGFDIDISLGLYRVCPKIRIDGSSLNYGPVVLISRVGEAALQEDISGVGSPKEFYGIEELSIDLDGFCLGRYPNLMSYCCKFYAFLPFVLYLVLLLLLVVLVISSLGPIINLFSNRPLI